MLYFVMLIWYWLISCVSGNYLYSSNHKNHILIVMLDITAAFISPPPLYDSHSTGFTCMRKWVENNTNHNHLGTVITLPRCPEKALLLPFLARFGGQFIQCKVYIMHYVSLLKKCSSHNRENCVRPANSHPDVLSSQSSVLLLVYEFSFLIVQSFFFYRRHMY